MNILFQPEFLISLIFVLFGWFFLHRKGWNLRDIPSLWSVRRAYVRGDYKYVTSICHGLLQGGVEHAIALDYLGRVSTNRKDPETALSYWERLSALRPNDHNVLLRMAKANFNLEEYSKTADICQELLEKRKNVDQAFNLALRAYTKLGVKQKIDDLAFQYNSQGFTFRHQIARNAYNRQNYAKSEALSKRILSSNPNDLGSLELLGRIYTNRKNYKLALIFWKRIAVFKPQDFFINMRIAKTAYNLDELDTASEACETILKKQPHNVEALHLKGRLFHKLKLWPEALEIYELLTKNKSYEWRLIDSRGQTNISDKEVWLTYIKLLYRASSEHEAQKALNDIKAQLSGTVQGHIDMAMIHENLLEPDQAREELSHALQFDGKKESHHLAIFKAYLDLGRLEMSYHHLIQAQQLNPNKTTVKIQSKKILKVLKTTKTSPEFLAQAYAKGTPVLVTERVIHAIVSKIKELKISQRTVSGRVAMVSSTLNRGGAERQVVLSLEGLKKNRERIESLTLLCDNMNNKDDSKKTFYPRIQNLDIDIETYGWSSSIQAKQQDKTDLREWKPLLQFLPYNIQIRIDNLYRYFIRLRPSVVHAWQDNTNILAGVAAAMAGVPKILLSARSLRPDRKTKLHAINTQHARNCYHSLLSLPAVTLCVNSAAAAESYAQWLDLDKDLFPVHYNGIDFESMEAINTTDNTGPSRIDLGIPSDSVLIGSVFRLTDEKRPLLWVDVAARVLQELPKVHFVIVGGGAMLAETSRYAKSLGILDHLHLPGQSSNVKAWLDMMDIFLFTSRVEGLPNVLIEAQGFGVPVVTTDAGGSREVIIHGESGWLVEGPKVRDISDRLLWCLNNPEWLKSASINAIEQSRRRFNQETMIDNLLSLYGFTNKET